MAIPLLANQDLTPMQLYTTLQKKKKADNAMAIGCNEKGKTPFSLHKCNGFENVFN